MKTRFWFPILMAGVAVSLGAADTPAPTPPGDEAVVAATVPGKRLEPRLIDVDFPGGSIEKLLAAVNKTDGVSFNIVNIADRREAAMVNLPRFSVRNVTLIDLHDLLRQLLQLRGFRLEIAGGGNPNSIVCLLKPTDAAPPPPNFQAQFVSYQLAPYLSNQSVDEIVSAIRTAWELDPTRDPNALRIKFHPGTQLLLVSGPPDGIFVAHSVINSLRRGPDAKAPAAPEKTPPPKS